MVLAPTLALPRCDGGGNRRPSAAAAPAASSLCGAGGSWGGRWLLLSSENGRLVGPYLPAGRPPVPARRQRQRASAGGRRARGRPAAGRALGSDLLARSGGGARGLADWRESGPGSGPRGCRPATPGPPPARGYSSSAGGPAAPGGRGWQTGSCCPGRTGARTGSSGLAAANRLQHQSCRERPVGRPGLARCQGTAGVERWPERGGAVLTSQLLLQASGRRHRPLEDPRLPAPRRGQGRVLEARVAVAAHRHHRRAQLRSYLVAQRSPAVPMSHGRRARRALGGPPSPARSLAQPQHLRRLPHRHHTATTPATSRCNTGRRCCSCWCNVNPFMDCPFP